MTLLRGWCPCGGPLWRFDARPGRGADGVCRLCSLESYEWRFSSWHDVDRADANSTSATAATSMWLPRGAREYRNPLPDDDDIGYERWLSVRRPNEGTIRETLAAWDDLMGAMGFRRAEILDADAQRSRLAMFGFPPEEAP